MGILNRLGIVKNRNRKEDPVKARVKSWFKVDGDRTLRLNYDLNDDSVVFDIGGYKGEWANMIYERYEPWIYCFEPVEEFARYITMRFDGNEKIAVYSFGLSGVDHEANISLNEDGSSLFAGKGERKIHLIDIDTFIKNNKLVKIDLMKINVEGGEYDILERLINTGFVKQITDIQVQFHDFVPNAEARMRLIQKELAKTHYLTYQYEFVWENWRLKH